MIVRREKPDAADMRGNVVQHGLSDSDTVVGGGTAAEFIEDDEGAGRSFSEDLFSFGQLDEECRLRSEDVVVGTEAGHDAVHRGEARGGAGDVAADLGHDYCDAGL